LPFCALRRNCFSDGHPGHLGFRWISLFRVRALRITPGLGPSRASVGPFLRGARFPPPLRTFLRNQGPPLGAMRDLFGLGPFPGFSSSVGGSPPLGPPFIDKLSGEPLIWARFSLWSDPCNANCRTPPANPLTRTIHVRGERSEANSEPGGWPKSFQLEASPPAV